jgi:hypothetical protein
MSTEGTFAPDEERQAAIADILGTDHFLLLCAAREGNSIYYTMHSDSVMTREHMLARLTERVRGALHDIDETQEEDDSEETT